MRRALLLALVAAGLLLIPAAAANTPDPTTVTVAGIAPVGGRLSR